jgi:phytanoyl-CoA hydroxylase
LPLSLTVGQHAFRSTVATMTATDAQTISLSPLGEQFVRDGFVVVPGLVSASQVDEIRLDAERFARGEYPADNLPDDGQILAIHFPHWVSEVARATVVHPGMADVLSQIAGAHLAHWDGRVKCMQSMLFLKPAGLQGQAWHQDERFIPTRDRSLVGAWIALDDANVENGCLWVIPGSHRMGQLWPTRDHGRPDEFDPSDEAFGFDDNGAIPVEVKAGDVVFFNGYLLHRSLKNRSTRTRRALVNHYMSAWSPLPWLVDRGIDVAMADNRAITMVVGDDPYEWRGIVTPPERTMVRPRSGKWSAPDPLYVDTSVAIAAPASVVWATLTDTASYGAWNPYITRVDGSLESGSVRAFINFTTGAPADGTSTDVEYAINVTELSDGKRMVWEAADSDHAQFHGVHVWDVTADGALTVVRHHERFSGAKALDTMDKIGGAIAHDFGRFNEALRVEAERRAVGESL